MSGQVLMSQTDEGRCLIICCKIFSLPISYQLINQSINESAVICVQVTYNVDGFLEKNRDTLSESIMKCMRHADALLAYELFSPLSEFGQLEVRYNQLQADYIYLLHTYMHFILLYRILDETAC